MVVETLSRAFNSLTSPAFPESLIY